MDFKSNLIINTYSIILLFIVYLHSRKHSEKEFLQYKLYIKMLLITIIMLVVDILSRFDGNPGTIYPYLNHLGNFLIFIISPILPSLWLSYVHYQIYLEDEKTKKLIYPLLAINAINAIMVLMSQFTGWLYYIDINNIYHRGSLFLLSASITVLLLLISFILIVINRKKIEKKYFFSLVFFAVPPFICVILQIMFYGISIILNGVVISMLIVFFNIQNQSIYTDYLTGVNNRKKLEVYLKEKVSTCTEDKTFSAIMLDLIDFKSINDTFGHEIGDRALQTAASLLNSCLRSNDFIARFGGDEFCIVLEISDSLELEAIVCRIKDCIKQYNELSNEPYILDFSIGYAVYDYHSHKKVEEFEKEIDILMYENKHAYKELKTNQMIFEYDI